MNEEWPEHRRKARVSPMLRKKLLSTCEDDSSGDGDVLGDRDEDAERYYLRKIRFYLSEIEEEREALSVQSESIEKELEESRLAQLELLVKIKDLRNRVCELEAKNTFYKNRLKKFEGEMM